MFAQTIDTYPVGVILALGIGGIVIVVIVVKGLLALAIEYADGEREHPFNELRPSHCDRCWHEAKRRQSAAQLLKDGPPLHVRDRQVRR